MSHMAAAVKHAIHIYFTYMYICTHIYISARDNTETILDHRGTYTATILSAAVKHVSSK
jgi:hypothetical protein